MKKILLAMILLASVPALSQEKQPVEKPVAFTRLEVDSAKSILTTVSQKLASISCLTQGDAAQMQQLFGMLFSTITRKEKEAAPPAEKPKK
jgi:hypothetical protein